MAQTQPWFRHYTGTCEDPKLKRAALIAGCERIVVNGAWSGMMEMAKSSPVEGELLIAKDTPATIYEIADKAGTADIPLLEKIIEAFIKLDMVRREGDKLILPHWSERQYASDHSTQRVKAWRERKKVPEGGNGGGNVSPPALRNGPESETDTETERETEASSPLYPASPEIQLYRDVTGLAPDYSTEITVREKIQAMRQKLGSVPRDELLNVMREKYALWCASKTGDGRPYNPSNPAWLDWCTTGFVPKPAAPPPERKAVEVWQ